MSYTVENINRVNVKALGVKFPSAGTNVFPSSFTTRDRIKANLINLLLTSKGERIMFTEFGTYINNALFEPSTVETAIFLQNDIQDAINKWLPEVRINEVEVITNEDDPTSEHLLQIFISVIITQLDVTLSLEILVNNNTTIEIRDNDERT